MTDYQDSKLRELTYRLMHMAPEAPPFPEAPMTTLKPQKSSSFQDMPPRRRNWAALGFAAAAALGLALLIALPLMLLRNGDGDEVGPTTTPPSTTTPVTTAPPVQTTAVDTTAYFLADYVEASNSVGPHLIPVHRTVEISADPQTATGQFTAAMVAMLDGPLEADNALVAGISSSIPVGTNLLGFSLDNSGDIGIATVDFSREFESGGGSLAMTSRLAQVVYTVTRLPEIDEVVFMIEGEPVTVFSAEGIVIDGPQTRDDYRDLLPLIFVESPLPGATLSSPVRIQGVANTFEAGLQYSLERRDGSVIAAGFTTATCGSGCWGDYDVTFDYGLAETTAGYLVVFDSSAQDGRPIDIVRVPVTIEPAEDVTADFVTEVYATIPGGSPLDGAVVVESPLLLAGSTNVATEVTVNGGIVPVESGSFEAAVDLQPGVNEIVVGDGVTDLVYHVTYLAGGTVEFTFLTEVAQGQIVADYAQWLTGDEANQAAIEDGEIAAGETVPNDYYIRNQNTQLRTLQVAADAVVTLPTPAFGSVENVPISLADWLALFKADGTPWNPESGEEPPVTEPHFGYFGAGTVYFGYWITLDTDGTVVQITGQYRP